MLYIFDKDGTLVSGVGNRPANMPEQQMPLPGVIAKLAALRAEGHKIAVASNQGGVAWGFITEAQAQSLIDDCIEKIGGVDVSIWCPNDPRAAGKPNSNPKFVNDSLYRKPGAGMLNYCMSHTDTHPSQTIFIGDMDSDKQAAVNAGVRFMWAKDFFGW